MQIGILGPVRIVSGGVERPGRGGVHRLLLSVLAAEQRPLDLDELLDVLCCVRPDRRWSRQHVYSAVARLRSELPDVVTAARGTYRLDRSRCVLDAERFEGLARQARNDLVAGDARAAVDGLREALGLWRGTALAEWRAHSRAEAMGARLDEIRLGAVEDLARALASAGEPGEAAIVARDLLAEHPEREHTWASLLLALDASGATDEVWRTFDEARRLLAAAGLEPGVEIEQVMARIASPGLAPGAGSWTAPSTEATLPPLVRLAADTALVGRSSELAALQQVATSVLEGGGARLVLVEGAAGVGKTRLAAELAAWAFAQGTAVWFEVGEDRLEAPYGPLANLVRRLIDGLDASERRQALAGPLARLVGGVESADAVHQSSTRWALAEAVAELISGAIPTGGVLVIDDLHNVPSDGADLIHHLLVSRPESRLLVVGTVRGDGAPVRNDPNRELRQLPVTTALHLEELASNSAVEVLARLTGNDLDRDEQRQRLMELTHGNPLLISAVANDPALRDEVRNGGRHGPLGVASVAAQVTGLLGRLNASSVAVLEAAAVVGRRFDRRVLWSVSGAAGPFGAGDVNDALIAGVRAGLLATDVAKPDEFAFVHELARRGIYDTLGGAERAHLHWSVGPAAAKLSATEDRTTVLAHHLLAAWPVCPTADVVDRLQGSALEAAHMLALTRADHLFELALDVADRDPSGVADHDHCVLLLLAAASRLELGRIDEAVALARNAVGVARVHGWRDEVGLALVGLADNCRVLRLPPRARGLLRYTRDVVPRARGDLLFLLQQADDDLAVAAEQQVLAFDASGGSGADAAAVVSALGAISFGHLGHRQEEAAGALSRLGESRGDPGLEGLGLLYRWAARIGNGQAGFDDDVGTRIGELAEAAHAERLDWSWHLWRAVVALHHVGDLGLAAHCLDTARAVLFTSHEDEPWLDARASRFDMGCSLVGAAIAAVSDDAARFERFQVLDLESGLSASHDFRSLQAAMHARAGQADQAAQLCDAVVGGGLLDRPRSQNWLVQVINLAAAYARLGDVAGARVLLPLLEEHRHCHVLVDAVWYSGSVERYLGLLRGACGDWDAALASFDAAIDRHEHAKAVTVNIQTYQQLAWALTHRGGAGDGEAADAWRERAVHLARSIGAAMAADDPWAIGG